ncbi:MAG: hypothetical protein FWD91_05095 [Treponema sp.]|nr:hypothetical protein [Treponema sp.]
MKTILSKGIAPLAVAALLALLASCEHAAARVSYQPVLPELPEHWRGILGEPHWRLQWIGSGGVWHQRETAPGSALPEIALMAEWATPVLAWPFWPERGIPPGMMRPSGALFPWDVRGGDLHISWEGGVPAFFWKSFAQAERSAQPSTAAAKRLPWNFDWPRFRELLASENIPRAVRDDPWLADWAFIAARTLQSGFDRRRITSRTFTELAIPGADGRWIGSSPFAAPIDAQTDGTLVIGVSATADTWISSSGVLGASTSGWVQAATKK